MKQPIFINNHANEPLPGEAAFLKFLEILCVCGAGVGLVFVSCLLIALLLRIFSN